MSSIGLTRFKTMFDWMYLLYCKLLLINVMNYNR